MSDTVQKIKEKVSILDVVAPYVKLTKAGKHYKGLSPFTKEKTPSFFVAPDRGLYHCFSTGKGGDMFTFIEEMEGVDFRGALKMLAEKAGVEIEPWQAAARDMRERLFTALASAERFFVESLKQKPEAATYLKGRGLKKETIVDWRLGYALKEWQALHEQLKKEKFTDLELERAGLIKKAEESEKGRFYDRFRGRIMFPLRDVSGRVVAFSGRIFEDDASHPAAKYLNSPETDVFDKSAALYGLDRAREGIRSLGAAILVEGQLDLLMAHQVGYKNSVATSGTAFTEKHAEHLKRYTPNLVISYDGDRAGISAAGRAAAIALKRGMNVKVAKLPPGKDPADLLKENPEVFRQAIKGALHVVDFYLAHIADAKYDPRTYRLEVSRTVIPYVAMIGNAIDRAHFIKRVAEALALPEGAVAEEVKKSSTAEPLSKLLSPSVPAGDPFLSRIDSILRLLFGLMLSLRESGDTENADKADRALHSSISEEELQAFLAVEEGSRAALFEADIFLERYPDTGAVSELIDELAAALEKETVHERYRTTLSALRSAEVAHDSAGTDRLMRELNELATGLA
ncbi:MAG: DNA primase [Patescibacteria group bacterium]|nr:DNA primase [Patescibacteria group bacterium]